ncbi:MAG: metallophosphoesterase [Syntrophobacteraceae bacterium]
MDLASRLPVFVTVGLQDNIVEEDRYGNQEKPQVLSFQGFGNNICKKLVTSDYGAWHSIYSKHDRPKGGHGEQTNFSLLNSAIRKMHSICPHPDFIIFSGDLLAHGLEAEYSKHSYPGHTVEEFVQNTLSFINYEFKYYFGNVPIYFTLGNNDNYTDFGIAPPPADTFLPDTKDIFFAYISGDADAEASFMATFPQSGSYSLHPAAAPTNKIIALNDIFFSLKSTQQSAGWQQIAWLESELASAAQNGEKVWIITHIPPGVDVTTTLSNHNGEITDFWETQSTDAQGKTFLEKFSELTVAYSSVIGGIFCGHTHMDHFRLISDQGVPKSFVHVTPAVSPQFKNNPAFQVLTYDTASFGVIEFQTYRYGYVRQGWSKEYSFNRTYGVSLYDPANLDTVFNQLQQDAAARKHFTAYYDVNNGGFRPITTKNWQSYWCGIANITDQDFATCTDSLLSLTSFDTEWE